MIEKIKITLAAIFFLVVTLFLSGCVSIGDFRNNFMPMNGYQVPTEEEAQILKASSTAEVPVIYSNELQADMERMFINGYQLIGKSDFVETNFSSSIAKKFAGEIGASYVIYTSRYSHTSELDNEEEPLVQLAYNFHSPTMISGAVPLISAQSVGQIKVGKILTKNTSSYNNYNNTYYDTPDQYFRYNIYFFKKM